MTEAEIQAVVDNVMGSFMYGISHGFLLGVFFALCSLIPSHR
jgi:hypothetical protein